MKKILSLLLSIALVIAPQMVYASEVNNETPQKILTEEEILEGKVVTVDLGDGNSFTLRPTSQIEPRLNVTKTMDIDGVWRKLAYDTPFITTNLRVINKSGPGSVCVKVVTSYATNNTHYCWDLPVGYEVEFNLRLPSEYTVYISTDLFNYGTYKLQATDW